VGYEKTDHVWDIDFYFTSPSYPVGRLAEREGIGAKEGKNP